MPLQRSLSSEDALLTFPPSAVEIVAALLQDGFAEGAPAHLQAWARDIDADLAASARCPECNAVGLRYCPFCRELRCGVQYRAVVQCQACGCGYEI